MLLSQACPDSGRAGQMPAGVGRHDTVTRQGEATGRGHLQNLPQGRCTRDRTWGPAGCGKASSNPRPGLTTQVCFSSGKASLLRPLGHPLSFQASSPLLSQPASRSREKTCTTWPGSCIPSAGGFWSRCQRAACSKPPRGFLGSAANFPPAEP